MRWIVKHRPWAYPVALLLFIYIFYFGYKKAGFWFFYAVLYTSVVILFGRLILRKRRERYIRLRTLSLMLAQLFLAFILPVYIFASSLGSALMLPWPLEIRSFYPGRPPMVLAYGASLLAALVVLVYLYGKRVFCSFLCTCGALAETLGDPFRKNAPRGKVARILDFRELALLGAIIATVAAFLGNYKPALWYLLVVTLLLAHAVALSAYPFYGGRIWCRYFCPLGSILGRVSALGRFAILTNADACDSCGKCTRICHMAIDVAEFASKGVPIKHRHCVGCGECVYACPKGALRFK